MSTRDLTKDFLRYRAQRQTTSSSSAASHRQPPDSYDSSRQRLTGHDRDYSQDQTDLERGSGSGFDGDDGSDFVNDDAGHRQWMDYRDAVENNFYELGEAMQKLRLAHREALEALDQRRYQAESERLAARITALLRDTDRSVKKIYVQELLGDDPQENALRKNVQVELSQKLYNLTVEFRTAQKDHMKKKMEQEQTVAKMTNIHVDEQTAANDISEDMIQELATTSNLINERDQEIANIAKSVQEIAEMFRDLSGLIIEQGTVLDRIDYNLEVALERTQAGVVHLEEAEKEQKKNRAVKCIFCLTLTTTACMIVYILKKTNKF